MHPTWNRLICLVLCLTLLSGCGIGSGADKPDQNTVPPTEATTAPTAPPDGNPNDVTCQGSYDVDASQLSSVAGDVVATMGDAKLTNELLQVYYWLEVAAYRQENHPEEPDFSRGLDTQLVPISSRIMTWQQFFLQRALSAWQSHQALVMMGQEEGVPTEEAYQPDMEKRLEYLSDKPANKYLYGWNESYVPNRLHQNYLDALPQMLETLAADSGFGSAADMAAAATGASLSAMESYADLANRAYMYFTEMNYHFEPTPEEIEAFYNENQQNLPADGEKTVNIRHILLLPENAQTAADGTVTAAEEDWNRCLTQAKNLVDKWLKRVKKTRYAQFAETDVAESRFYEFANAESADPGSNTNGGLYVNLRQGQLVPELDAWCFDEARQHGDYEIIRSACGYHIVFFSAANGAGFAAAQAEMTRQYGEALVQTAAARHPMEVNYSAIKLGSLPDNGSFITPSDLVYPDVAHERFPDMPLYLQQDYPEAPYGNYKLSTHGCGITTLSMVASYLADDELTPVELAARYGYYCGPRGTEQVLFDDTPAEMGFRFLRRAGSWSEAVSAIREGYVVVSLQWAGYWTGGGHYLAIIDETEDEKYVVRDSNLINYKRIPAHREDSHTRGSITQACHGYWIYDKKVTSIPTCVRCGTDGSQTAPEVLLQSDYHCAKCLTAMERRSNFLAGFGA